MLDFGDVPTWIAAIGTVGALFAALWQIGNERKRRIQQQEGDREKERLDQARLIAAWIGPEDDARSAVELSNGSPEPVYNVVATIVFIQGTGPSTGEEWAGIDTVNQKARSTTAAILAPGHWRVWIAAVVGAPLSGRKAAEVAFTDRNGAHWVRRANGTLEELPEPPFQHFALTGPYDLVTPEDPDRWL